MTAECVKSIIAFVWPHKDITPPVVETARSTKTCAIFDLSSIQPVLVRAALLRSGAACGVVDLKISPAFLVDPRLEKFLDEMGISRIWVELHPNLIEEYPEHFLKRLEVLSDHFDVVPVVGAIRLISEIVDNHPGIKNIALKGNEASGFTGPETILTLYGAIISQMQGRSKPPGLIVWGGIATPEAAASFLSAGVRGIVFESLHWLTDLVSINDEARWRISNLRADHTELTGLNFGVPCRIFNKGNSQAVRELKSFAGSLCGSEILDEQRRLFARKILDEAIHPLESSFSRKELIPLGVEAAFAAAFVRRFGSDANKAIENFISMIDACCATAADKEKIFVNSPIAREMGTKYPFIQGAMSWITDVPEFALKVFEAGGLPTIALGLMDGKTLDEKFGRMSEIMGTRPYAANVITLPENPYRDIQLAWIEEKRPKFAVIAAGEPSYAVALNERGVEAVYIASSEELLKMALDAGIRYIICEGYEAGGHVGRHSTLTLAQIVIDMKERSPSLFEGRRIILAGGICNRETAFIAAMLGADAIQMGTSYLTTAEIVETGALTSLYQRMILESSPEDTVVTGEGTGLRVRSLKTAKIEAICSLEREFAAGTEDESSFRNKIEALSAGSLFIAAHGMDRPGGMALDAPSCLAQGQFMSGACAGALRKIRTIGELHRELAEAPLSLRPPVTGSSYREPISRQSKEERIRNAPERERFQAHQPAYGKPNGERIAITGMSIINSLGNSPGEVWAASVAMKSGVVPVPKHRWNHELFFHPHPRMPEKTYCKVGAFQHIEISRKDIDIPPHDFRTMTNATRITMWLADKAIEESGILESGIPRERISVLISQNSGEAAATLQDVIIRGSLTQIMSAVKRVINLTPETEKVIEDEIKAGRIAIDDTTLLGRLNCSAVGFICNRYGFMGPGFAVSAACATALVALYSAVQLIRNGVIDAAIVGGAEEFLTPMHFLEFSAIGALAGLSGSDRLACETSRPFDADRDGMVLGEGGGMVVIERESVARQRGAGVHAYITSMGASNNHLGMVESSRVTQEIAIRSSLKDTSYGPDGVDLIECHATSTRQGDLEEVQALRTFFDSGRRTVLTSFKSQIGHTLGASGINSLIRGVMAMKSGVFPPTLNFRNSDPEMGIKGSALTIYPMPAEWKSGNGHPRRLQVNAFGFGGSNYVVQVEQAMEHQDSILVSPFEQAASKLDDCDLSAQGIYFFRTVVGEKPCRVSAIANSEAEAIAHIQSAASIVNNGNISSKRLKVLTREGIHLGSEDMPIPPIAFVFPGQGTHYAGMGYELYQAFPVVRQWMDRAAEAAEFDLLQLLFHDREENLQKTRWQQPALFTMEYAMAQYLVSLGIRPQALAGHSLGELTALCLAGVYSFEDGFRIVNMRAMCMDKACKMNVDPGAMIAVDAPMDILEKLLGQRKRVYITNINSPHQSVVGGSTEAVKSVEAELKALGCRSTLLRVSMAFHSPVMRCIHDELEDFIAGIEFHTPQIPVISNTTMQPFPANGSEIKAIVMAHLESPVHWMQNVRTLWNDYGVRLFVEVGPRAILSNLIVDSIEKAECIQTCLPSVEPLIFKTALAQLFVTGNLPVHGPVRLIGMGALPGVPVTPAPEVLPMISKSAANPQHMIQTTDNPVARPEKPDCTEAVIRIIMDATGYDRDEIGPEMDLRDDLSIRSSRLPVIMDAVENYFGIKIELKDFVDVRTVKDISDRIADVVTQSQEKRPSFSDDASSRISEGQSSPEISRERQNICRLIFRETPIDAGPVQLIELSPFESVAIFSTVSGTALSKSTGDIFRRDYGANIIPLTIVKDKMGQETNEFDLRADEGASMAAEHLHQINALAGMVLIVDDAPETKELSMEDVAHLLKGFFSSLKAFLESPAKKFVLLLHKTDSAEGAGRLLAEGLLGIFLSAAQEFEAVQFRTVKIHRNSEVRDAVRGALNRGQKIIETVFRDGETFSCIGVRAQSVFQESEDLELGAEDVVVFSGGGSGITSFLARSLVPFGCRMVFLGRSEVCSNLVGSRNPNLSCPECAKKVLKTSRETEIARTVEELRLTGTEVTYVKCDVTDRKEVETVVREIINRYGKIDGIVHGAGILRDNWVRQMTSGEFAAVMNVKFLGAWNLHAAAEKHGLKFFVCLSSVASIQGNPGQANYAAGNRLMSALMAQLRDRNQTVRFKALMLPPISGAGMAENPDVKALMTRMKAGYIHADELAVLFCRELFVAPPGDVWVLFMRSLPDLNTVLLDAGGKDDPALEKIEAGTVEFGNEKIPMIETVLQIDLLNGSLQASRSIRPDKDLWIQDHKPFKFLKHPLVSAIMVVEIFVEAARILYPYLKVRGIRDIRFLDMIDCPPEVRRPLVILCRRIFTSSGEMVCEVSIASGEGSSSERTERMHTNYNAHVILSGSPFLKPEDIPGFPVRLDELDSRPMDCSEVIQWYHDRSDLLGRYRVIENLNGTSSRSVRGEMIYREIGDFAVPWRTQYQYSPYLLEALIQVMNFYTRMRNLSEDRSMIPYRIGDVQFMRKCSDGEKITIEARMQEQNEEGISWNARALDKNGKVVMQAKNVIMRWFSK